MRKPSEIFAARLREWTDSGRMSVAAVAAATGVSRVSLYRYMDGETVPGLDQAERVATAFGVPLRDMIDEHPAPPVEHDIGECARRVCRAMESCIPQMACEDKSGSG